MEIKKPNLNKIIDSLEKQINNISITYDCNITRRRAEQLRQNLIKQDNLKDIQAKAKGLNEMWENNEIPEQLKNLSSVKDIELLSYEYNEYVSEEESPLTVLFPSHNFVFIISSTDNSSVLYSYFTT